MGKRQRQRQRQAPIISQSSLRLLPTLSSAARNPLSLFPLSLFLILYSLLEVFAIDFSFGLSLVWYFDSSFFDVSNFCRSLASALALICHCLGRGCPQVQCTPRRGVTRRRRIRRSSSFCCLVSLVRLSLCQLSLAGFKSK